ncbi:MAG: hypothetical protein A4E53_03855 [Pelotomaculum sp. PtaB.Bin104]|nr:MAG: hypothetical protein A4E53_03855 [Pelotomaculum sp. PtaB.Bin104]
MAGKGLFMSKPFYEVISLTPKELKAAIEHTKDMIY